MAEDELTTNDGAVSATRQGQLGRTASTTRVTSSELRERLDRFGAATESLLDRLSRTQALLDDAARIVEPGFQRASGMGNGGPHERAPIPRRHHVDQGAVLSLAEVSERTGRHPDLLRRWSETGRIPAIRVGRSWAIPESVLPQIAWPAARRRKVARQRLVSAERAQHEQSDGRAVDVEG